MSGESLRPLSGVDLFDDIPPQDIAMLTSGAQPLFFGAGQVIFSSDYASDRLFVVMTGEIRTILHAPNGKSVQLRRFRPSPFACIPLLDARTDLLVTVEAATPTTIMAIRAADFFDLLGRYPLLLGRFVAQQAAELTNVVEQLVEVVTLGVRARLAGELLKLGEAERLTQGAATITDPPSHAELARRISSNRETVSREVSRMQSLGMVVRRGSSLVIPDVRRLNRLRSSG